MGAFTYDLGEWFGGPWSGAIQIDSSLVADGGAAYLRYVAHSAGSISLRLSATATGVPPLPGPELSEDFEGYDEAVVLTDGSGNTVTIRGPAHPDNTSTDPTEPYSWTPENSADFTAWSAAAVDSEISITLDDGIPDTEYGDGAAIEGVGTLGEATGLTPIVGDGAAIEGVGSLGEATGLVPIVGDGAAIEGRGSLGEATGLTPIFGDGASIEGRGSLGEADGVVPLHGEGASIEGVGTLGEADGVVPVHGEGASIEGVGTLGEATGFPPVEGKGAPIEGEGTLGEAEGEALGTVTGEGAAIEGRGSLGEAEGEALAAVRGEGDSIEGRGSLGEATGLAQLFGDGASIEGEGSLGEAEGIANLTVYGDGDGLRGEGSLGNAEGRSEIGAVDLKLYVNFTGSLTGTPDPTDTNDPWSDVTSVISITRGMVFDCVDGTQDHHFAPDIIRVRLRQSRDATLVRKVRASRRIGGVLIMHGEIVWRGFILSGKAQRVDDAPDDLEIEGVDHAERLRVPCGAVDERDATVLEIVESLISSVPGVVTDDTSDIVHMEPAVDATRLETMVEHFARRPGEATILALVDGLLHQYGYILYARANGLFGVRSWWYSETEYDDHTATAPRLVDDGFMQSGLRSEHRETNHESVAVEWSDVIEQDNALLYRENLPINSEGEHTGVIVLGGTNYPARGGVDAIWQEYRPDWLVGAAGRGSGGDLLYATNQSVEIDVDTDISVQTKVHEPLRSRVVLRNTGTNDTRRLRQFDIRGDAVFRSATRVTVVTTIPAVQTTVDDAVSNTVIQLAQTTNNTVDTADGAYVGWTAVVAGIDATVLSYDGSDLEITLAAEPDGWAVADDDDIVLRPPANGETLRMQADAVFDVDDARALAVASKNDILQAESYRFPAQYEDTPVVGSEALTIGQFVRLTYPDWELDELVCIVRERVDIIGEIAGGEPSRVELELIPVVELDSTDAFPGPTLAAAGISVQQGPPGRGLEFIFARTSTTTAPSAPSNSWGYDSPVSPWQDSAPALDATDMFLWSAQRIVVGSPSTGDAVSYTWSTPVIVGRFGEDGIIGADGEDGLGLEWIFAKTSTTTAPSAPSNSWGYDSPSSPWSDGAPDLDSTDQFLWRAQRDVEGAPSVGDAISDTWSTPVIVGHFGEDGAAGADGNDGTDGIGIEFIFAKTSTTTAPSAPSNSWGYDSPISPWQDSAPALDATDQYLWSAQRTVVGSPETDDAVNDTWSTSVIVGRFGEDGIIGADGEDGLGLEWIFAKTSTTAAPSAPSNSWGYDSPISPWSDGAPDLDSTDRFLWRAQRDVEGAPSVGDAISDTWSTSVIVGHFGEDGAAGADGSDGADGDAGNDGNDGSDGVPGERGSTFISHEVSSGNSWSSAGATVDGTSYSGGDDIADALASFGDGPQPNDYVTLYRGSFVETRVWDGSDWATVDAFLDGNLVVDGSVIADKLAANAVTAVKIAANAITAAKIAAGAITANKIAANTITATHLAANSVTASEIAAGAVTASELAADSITASKIAAGAITADVFTAGSITGNKIAAGAITASKISSGAITAAKISSGAITAAKISAGAITANKIAANTITASQLAANSVTASEISAGAVRASELAADSVTASKIAAGAVTADVFTAGSIDADKLATNILNTLLANIGNSSSNIQIDRNAITFRFNNSVRGRIRSGTDHNGGTNINFTGDVDATGDWDFDKRVDSHAGIQVFRGASDIPNQSSSSIRLHSSGNINADGVIDADEGVRANATRHSASSTNISTFVSPAGGNGSVKVTGCIITGTSGIGVISYARGSTLYYLRHKAGDGPRVESASGNASMISASW